MYSLKLLLFTTTITFSLYASPTTCTNIYFDNDAPDIINTKLTKSTKELCYKEFALMHSGVSKGPLWSAEHLTRNMLSGKAERSNDFHAEERLSHDERAELNDYAHSGYDRGHMAPSADFIDPQSNQECFTLANMVPKIITIMLEFGHISKELQDILLKRVEKHILLQVQYIAVKTFNVLVQES